MEPLDWFVVGIYIAVVVGISVQISRRQKSEADYYVAGRRLGAWPIALSMAATQCSAISLIGAPAFIAIKKGGGMSWLQYELAVPLAAIAIIFLIPVFFHRRITTIYETIEERFGPAARTTLSAIFLVSRGLGTAVGLYATAVVVAVCLNWSLGATLLLVGAISILYTTLGGIEADIYSDMLQLAVLYAGTLVCIVVVVSLLGDEPIDLAVLSAEQKRVLDFSHHGWGDGRTFAFWPMLIGGFFLYVSYYGCDQSQVQRLLSGADAKTAEKALVLNGVLRFPLVLTYCVFGLLLAVWLVREPNFAEKIPATQPNFLVPMFIRQYVPTGIRGIIVAGIIAAAMSSLDSAMNSLSAATQRDFLERFVPQVKKWLFWDEVKRARAITVIWGLICTGLAFMFAGGAHTVIELVNMVGSAVYGPILAVFVMALLRRKVAGAVIVTALLMGVAMNILLWQWAPEVSWLWWNVAGCVVTFFVALLGSSRQTGTSVTISRNIVPKVLLLGVVFLVILSFLIWLDKWL